MKQLITAKLTTKDYAGWCLRFVGDDYVLKNRPHPDAWDAWSKAKKRHASSVLPNAIVPVFFEWWGTIDGVYKNWGDVAIYVPGRGVFGTPASGAGKSNRWDSSPEARAKWLGGKARYVGWTEDLNGYQLVEWYKGQFDNMRTRVAVLTPNNGKWNLYKPNSDVVGKVLTIPKGDTSFRYIHRGACAKGNRINIMSGGQPYELPLANVQGKEYKGEFHWG